MPKALPKKLIKMSEYKVTTYEKQNLVYVPKPLIRLLGKKAKGYANCVAVLMFPENSTLESVLESLKIIESHLRLKIKLKGEQLVAI